MGLMPGEPRILHFYEQRNQLTLAVFECEQLFSRLAVNGNPSVVWHGR